MGVIVLLARDGKSSVALRRYRCLRECVESRCVQEDAEESKLQSALLRYLKISSTMEKLEASRVLTDAC